MTRIDQFESVFNAAARTVYRFEPVSINKAMVITDLGEYEAHLFGDQVRQFLGVLGDVTFVDVAGDRCRSIGDVLQGVEDERPDLICTYRHLHSAAWRWPYALGEHLVVLTQATSTPVLVLPRPEQKEALAELNKTRTVMAITSHLAGDHHLVSVAAAFTEHKGELFLTHIEDEAEFERYIEAIGKIPGIDTEAAREEIAKRLLKDARDYITSCDAELKKHALALKVEPLVTMGHHLTDYRRLIDEHDVDLLVFNTKDDDQLAMHGLAYPLAVELRNVPLLML